MLFRLIYDDKLAQAAYLIGCQRTGEAIIIDPERDVDRYIAITAAEKLRITAVTETHIHADFLSGTREMAERTGAKVIVSGDGGTEWQYEWLNKKTGGGNYAHQIVKNGDTFRVGNIEFKVMHTPGHTPEHICFAVTDRGSGATEPMGVLTGDFVFVGDVGRPDLLETAAGVAGAKENSARQLFGSAHQFITLPEYLQIWPAHGAGSACGKALGAVPQTTIGYEKRFNPALKLAMNESGFLNYVLEGQPEPPLYFARMKKLNKTGPPVLGKLPQPSELSVEEMKKLDAGANVIIDTRTWAQFKAGHIAGSLYIPLGTSFPTVAGSYVDPEKAIVLVVDAARVDEAVRCLVRVGLDNITGFITPQTLAQVGKLTTSAEVDVNELKRRIENDEVFVLDVRAGAEHNAGAIPGTLNIVHTRLPSRLSDVPRDKPILVHCQGGGRSALATALLQREGYDAANVAGGFSAWEQSGHEVVKPRSEAASMVV